MPVKEERRSAEILPFVPHGHPRRLRIVDPAAVAAALELKSPDPEVA
jgi:hypothetical protein